MPVDDAATARPPPKAWSAGVAAVVMGATMWIFGARFLARSGNAHETFGSWHICSNGPGGRDPGGATPDARSCGRFLRRPEVAHDRDPPGAIMVTDAAEGEAQAEEGEERRGSPACLRCAR